MKNIYKRILGTSFVLTTFSFGIISEALAQSCTVAPTCESMGYTFSENQCEGRTILKCPFDNSKLFCSSISEAIEKGNCENPNIGDILYSDMSCSTEIIPEKTPIGVIFEPQRRLAIALDEATSIYWMENPVDIPGLENKKSQSAALIDFNGKNNTKTIVDYCKVNDKICPAFDYVYFYKTKGTNIGDWFVPAAGELQSIYDKKAKLNETLQALGKTELTNFYYWSSTEHETSAWSLYFSSGRWGIIQRKNPFSVRPVLAF